MNRDALVRAREETVVVSMGTSPPQAVCVSTGANLRRRCGDRDRIDRRVRASTRPAGFHRQIG
jgi:hypothetical protein